MLERPLSLTDFLTDGSVAALCDAVSRLTDTRLTVRDAEARRIVRAKTSHSAIDKPWRLQPHDDRDDDLALAIATAIHRNEFIPVGRRLLCPMFVGDHPIGAITVERNDDDPSNEPPEPAPALQETVRLLVSTISEVCESQNELRSRHSALRLLYRLSSLLVAAHDLDAILQVALRSAIDIFRMDAGSIHLLDDEREHLVLRAHVELPMPFIESVANIPISMPDDAVGEPEVDLNDTATRFSPTSLIEQGRSAIVTQMHEHQLMGLISGALAYNHRPLGVLRLYGRDPVLLDPTQHALLQTVAELVSAAVAGANLIESQRRHRQMERQMSLAADVQRRMLPRDVPKIPKLDIAARYSPCFDLGGDFYDFIELSGNLGVNVGDVSGKGVPAALLMASVRASLRAHALGVYHLDDVMNRVNQALVRDTLDNEFATIFYGVIDLKSLRLTYCNAGHEPPFIIRTSPDRAPTPTDMHRLEIGGMVVGIDADQRYERGMWDLRSGDVLVIYTDGIIDALNFSGEKFGRQRFTKSIMDILTNDPAASAKSIADHLIWEMRRFAGLNPELDDTTIVVMRVK